MAPHAAFATANIAREPRLFFAGRPACEGSVVVVSGANVLAEARLSADRSVAIEFPSPGRGPVELRFSSSKVDGQRRSVSFRLDATNLFGEGDL